MGVTFFLKYEKETNYPTRCSNPDGYHVTLNSDLNQFMSLAMCCQIARDDKWLVEVGMGSVAMMSTGSCCSRKTDSCLLHWEGRGDELWCESCLVCSVLYSCIVTMSLHDGSHLGERRPQPLPPNMQNEVSCSFPWRKNGVSLHDLLAHRLLYGLYRYDLLSLRMLHSVDRYDRLSRRILYS